MVGDYPRSGMSRGADAAAGRRSGLSRRRATVRGCTRTTFAPRRSRLAAGLTLAVATLALAAAAPAHAETGLGTALKNTAIAGTVATWTVAALKGAPFFGCLAHGQSGNDAWGGRVAAGKDSELSYEIDRRRAPRMPADRASAGFSLDMSPVISASAWQAKSDSRYSHSAWDVALRADDALALSGGREHAPRPRVRHRPEPT